MTRLFPQVPSTMQSMCPRGDSVGMIRQDGLLVGCTFVIPLYAPGYGRIQLFAVPSKLATVMHCVVSSAMLVVLLVVGADMAHT